MLRGDGQKQARVPHGERTRRDILGTAEDLAAREGLEGLTIGRLADEVGMSKTGVFAHFGSKEALQLATVDAAHQRFLEEVAAPALQEPPGRARLRAAIDRYFVYVERRVAAGGCFFTAASLEMDDRPGPVKDRIIEVLRARDALIADSIDQAIRKHELPRGPGAAQLAFEVISLALGAVTQFQMTKDPGVLARARTALRRCLEGPDAKAGPRKRPRAKASGG